MRTEHDNQIRKHLKDEFKVYNVEDLIGKHILLHEKQPTTGAFYSFRKRVCAVSVDKSAKNVYVKSIEPTYGAYTPLVGTKIRCAILDNYCKELIAEHLI